MDLHENKDIEEIKGKKSEKTSHHQMDFS